MNVAFYELEIFDNEDCRRHVDHLTMRTRRNRVTMLLWLKMVAHAKMICPKRRYEILRIEVIDIERL